MSSRYLLRVAYDGSKFSEMAKGHTGCGVIHLLENAIIHTLGCDNNIKVACSPSSRTDKKVHAINNAILLQISPEYDININKEDFVNQLNSTIDLVNPNSMKILEYNKLSPGFCIRRHVSYRIYTYRLAIAKNYDIYDGYKTSQSLVYFSEKDYAWILPPGFDTGKAQEACNMFKGFQNVASFYKHPERARRIEIIRNIPFLCTWRNFFLVQVGAGKAKVFDNDLYDYVNVSIVSRSFVREQIRRMMSVITACGYGTMEKSTIKYLLDNPRPYNFHNMKIPVAPPQGLFLTDVVYDPSMYTKPIPYFTNPLCSENLNNEQNTMIEDDVY